MGRSKLKNLKETTLNTFFDLAKQLNISNQFDFNAQKNIIYFHNGSEIILKDLFLYPSDPNFDSLGSLEITGAFIDECNQIVYKAWQIVLSRCRYKLKEWDIYGNPTNKMKVIEIDKNGIPTKWQNSKNEITSGLTPKVLGTCNPSKNWTYSEFYKKKKDKQLPVNKKFIQALPSDNPHLPKSYIESLSSLENTSKERLLYGNWEYDNDPNTLIEYDAILDLFNNSHVKKGKSYISTDIAMQGSDRFVVGSWSGLNLKIIKDYNKTDGKEVVENIVSLKNDTNTPNSRIVYDSDGVGNYLSGFLKGAKGFVNNGKPISVGNKNIQYQNLKTQCQYKLAEYINERKIYISAKLSEETKKLIIEELEQLKSYQTDRDGKLKTVPKHLLKQTLGRSPDFLDMLTMRMLFELKPKRISRTATV